MKKVRLEDVGKLAEEVLAIIPQKNNGATIIALSGDLGAGKTTFTQALAKKLGIEEVVQSPTYVLMKSYPISFRQFTRLIHIDLYRFTNNAELVALRPESFLHNPHALVVIEWPERVEGALPTPDLVLNFSSDGAGEGERYIGIQR